MKDKQETKPAGVYKKKGAAESVKQEIKDLDKMPGDVKQMDTPPARKKGAAASKPDANGDGVPDYAQDGIGASRMGFTQNFGAARQNSYAKGAARVASIMSFGASKKKRGPADNDPSAPHKHPHAGIVEVGMGSGVEVTGDASGIDNTITSTKNDPISVHSTNSKVFKKNYGDAMVETSKVVSEENRKVRADLKTNKEVQNQRRKDGMDYQQGTGTSNQITVRRS